MAFDNPKPEPFPQPPPHNDRMMQILQQRIGAMTLAMIELETRLVVATEELEALKTRVKA